MELHELVAAVAAYVAGDEGKAKDVAQAIRRDDSTKAVATVLLNAGAGRKKGEAQQREQELTAQITALQEERDALAAQAEAAASAPNERITALERERDKYKAKAEETDRKWKDEQVGRRQDRVGTRVESVVGQLRGKVEDGYLDEVIRPKLARRLRPQEQGDGVEALEEDGTPYDGDERAQLESVKASLLKTVPEWANLRPGMQPGGGAGRGGQGSVTREQIMAEKARSRTYTTL
jgi:outer membrane murein-binding lipoprotein Lpp